MERDAVVGRALRTPRAAAVAGILFALLLMAALVLVRVGAPPDPRETGAWLTDPGGRGLVALALQFVPFAGIAFLWFIGVVRDRIGEREDQFFATVFLGSGLLFVGMLFVATAMVAGLLAGFAGRSGAPTAAIGLRTGFMPRWIAWSGYAIAVVLLLAIGICAARSRFRPASRTACSSRAWGWTGNPAGATLHFEVIVGP